MRREIRGEITPKDDERDRMDVWPTFGQRVVLPGNVQSAPPENSSAVRSQLPSERIHPNFDSSLINEAVKPGAPTEQREFRRTANCRQTNRRIFRRELAKLVSTGSYLTRGRRK